MGKGDSIPRGRRGLYASLELEWKKKWMTQTPKRINTSEKSSSARDASVGADSCRLLTFLLLSFLSCESVTGLFTFTRARRTYVTASCSLRVIIYFHTASDSSVPLFFLASPLFFPFFYALFLFDRLRPFFCPQKFNFFSPTAPILSNCALPKLNGQGTCHISRACWSLLMEYNSAQLLELES